MVQVMNSLGRFNVFLKQGATNMGKINFVCYISYNKVNLYLCRDQQMHNCEDVHTYSFLFITLSHYCDHLQGVVQ